MHAALERYELDIASVLEPSLPASTRHSKTRPSALSTIPNSSYPMAPLTMDSPSPVLSCDAGFLPSLAFLALTCFLYMAFLGLLHYLCGWPRRELKYLEEDTSALVATTALVAEEGHLSPKECAEIRLSLTLVQNKITRLLAECPRGKPARDLRNLLRGHPRDEIRLMHRTLDKIRADLRLQ
ncbi:hypothetical protein BD413DRAFT_165714 [Trametes elegans]|nr:hypothetical protein BD413DRAFT_165714 [Trametes elegans]